MRRIGYLVILLALMITFGAANKSSAAPPQKVEICHVTGNSNSVEIPFFGGTIVLTTGHVIEVAPNAVDAHLAHGDSEFFLPVDDASDVSLWALFGLETEIGECVGIVFIL